MPQRQRHVQSTPTIFLLPFNDPTPTPLVTPLLLVSVSALINFNGLVRYMRNDVYSFGWDESLPMHMEKTFSFDRENESAGGRLPRAAAHDGAGEDGGKTNNNEDLESGSYDYVNNDDDVNNKVLITGSFANCTGHSIKEAMSDHLDQKRETISCQTLPYRMPKITAIDREIFVGMLSGAGGEGPNRRKVIHETWGQAHPKAKVYFLVAGPWEGIQSEYNEYGNLLWIDHNEVYEGNDSVLLYKTEAFLKVMNNKLASLGTNGSSKYLFKTDNDSFVILDKLSEYLEDLDDPPDYWGWCKPNPPIRDKKHKWGISREVYPEDWYPPYCQGADFLCLGSSWSVSPGKEEGEEPNLGRQWQGLRRSHFQNAMDAI